MKKIFTILAGLVSLASSVSANPLHLSWDANYFAVKYQLTVQRKNEMLYQDFVYQNEALLPEDLLSGDETYTVQPFDFDGNPISKKSVEKNLKRESQEISKNAPLPRKDRSSEQGGALLYPVYSFLGNPGAHSYEVEVWDGVPEESNKLWSTITTLTDLYDESPRIGTYYWRVRGLDKEGNPVGEWSEAQKRNLSTEGYEVGIFGDSISHGGGRMSYSPNDLEYSYAHYLNIPVVNLSESGDTSLSMEERFERDVLPFHVKTLLIMGGSNSLRGGASAEEVVDELETIRQLAIANGIQPILLTLPPINPSSIDKVFHEPTAIGWQLSFWKVNRYIKSVPHIDIGPAYRNLFYMPVSMALDGLHGDQEVKKRMGELINKEIKPYLSRDKEGK